jgi:hypothetical protein
MAEEKSSCSIGCLGLVITVMTVWAWWFGLPTSWGKLNIDIFPPGVYLQR